MNSIRACLLSAVALVAITVLSWWGWVGSTEIPYAPWRVAACVITLLVAAVVVGTWVRPWLPLATVPLALTVAWSVPAAREDETGMWGVGAIMVLVGSLMVGAVLVAVTTAARSLLSTRAARE